jgi:hypothetical protein
MLYARQQKKDSFDVLPFACVGDAIVTLNVGDNVDPQGTRKHCWNPDPSVSKIWEMVKNPDRYGSWKEGWVPYDSIVCNRSLRRRK